MTPTEAVFGAARLPGGERPPEGIGIYLHFPYCPTKCGYCDFNAYLLPRGDAFSPYTRALIQEMGQVAARENLMGMDVATVFMGGGTPSLFPPGDLAEILLALRTTFTLREGAEISLEANPGGLRGDDLKALVHAGFNRISIGAQTFHPGLLKAIGRIHSPEEIDEAVHLAQAAGFSKVNLDLMYGLPGQSEADLEEAVARTVSLGTGHVSAYALELEPKTPFYHRVQKGELVLPEEETVLQMGDRLAQALVAAGFNHYEVSNFARPGESCLHNVRTWRRGRYRGFGCGAHSFMGERRFWNVDPPGLYQRLVSEGRPVVQGEEDVTRQRKGEWVYLSLRLLRLEGARFRETFGMGLEEAFPVTLPWARSQGWLIREGTDWVVAEKMRWLLNRLAEPFLEEGEDPPTPPGGP